MVEKYMCPVCEVKAELDLEKKTKTLYLTGIVFPTHPDCELVKRIDKIDTSKLRKL